MDLRPIAGAESGTAESLIDGGEVNEQIFWNTKYLASHRESLIVKEGTPNQIWLKTAIGCFDSICGKQVLDCGCGSGFTTICLAKMGAQVTAFDISREAVERTKLRAVLNAVAGNIRVFQADFTGMGLNHQYDIIFGQHVLHHVELTEVIPILKRMIKANGEIVFIETQATNPILMFARRHLTGRFGIRKHSSPAEAPLTSNDFEIIKEYFPHVRLYFATMDFFFRLAYNVPAFDHSLIHPVLKAMDKLLWFFPFLRRYSYQVVVKLQ